MWLAGSEQYIDRSDFVRLTEGLSPVGDSYGQYGFWQAYRSSGSREVLVAYTTRHDGVEKFFTARATDGALPLKAPIPGGANPLTGT